MTVVSDASPIINLDAIGHLDLLRGLYDDLLIPPAVHDEVTAAPGSQEPKLFKPNNGLLVAP